VGHAFPSRPRFVGRESPVWGPPDGRTVGGDLRHPVQLPGEEGDAVLERGRIWIEEERFKPPEGLQIGTLVPGETGCGKSVLRRLLGPEGGAGKEEEQRQTQA